MVSGPHFIFPTIGQQRLAPIVNTIFTYHFQVFFNSLQERETYNCPNRMNLLPIVSVLITHQWIGVFNVPTLSKLRFKATMKRTL